MTGITRLPTRRVSAAAAPRIGARVEGDGRAFREVTFSWHDPDPAARVMVHVNSLTDHHRDDIRPALLERIVGTSVLAATMLVDEAAIASYRYVSDPALPLDAGRTRAGWLRVHEAGRVDPHNPERLPDPLGRHSSVLRMPQAPTHRAWDAGPRAVRGRVRSLTASDPEFGPRRVSVWTPRAPASRLLVLFDGDTWSALGLAAALERRSGPHAVVALVSSISPEARTAQLPHPERAAAVLERQVLPALASIGHRFDAGRTIVSGESYGGLAAAGIAVTRPDLARTALARSSSFHFRGDGELRRDADEPGTLSDALADHPPVARLMLSVGTEEGVLLSQGRRFAERAEQAGFDITHRERAGGHDYAWWRHELFRTLDEVLGDEPGIRPA